VGFKNTKCFLKTAAYPKEYFSQNDVSILVSEK